MENSPVVNELHELLLSGQKRIFKKGQVINANGNAGLSLIKSGFIMRYIITNSGSISIQSIYGPDYFYPLTYVFKLLFNQNIYTGPETIYYETLTDSEIYTIDNRTFLEAIKKNQSLYKAILKESGKRFYSNIQTLENTSLSTAPKRVAHLLLYYAAVFSIKTTKGNIQITVPLTHATIAGLLSLARETVSHSVIELRDLGLIKTTQRKYIVPDIDKLRQFTYS